MAQPDYQSQGAAMKHQPALNDTEMQKRKKKLVDETFDRMLKLLRQLGLNQKSPKFFVIYAHDSKDNELRAHQEVVKNYIAWFKKVLFNVDSDKSPHGWGLVHTVEHAYASLNIIDNQLCLLPTGWHKVNVDYILVFYSKLLASYVRHERSYKDEKSGKTYTEALTDACSKYQDPSKIPWNDLRSDIFKVQEHYSKSMGSGFHHVLTELALLNFRNGRARDIRTTIPIILGLDDCWEEKELHWQVDAIQVEQTQIRIYVKPGKEHLHFFKILMQFESLAEVDRQLIDLLAKCYEDSIGLLESDVSYIQHPEKYDAQLESLITGTLRTLNDQWQSIPRPITVSHIRDSLTLFTKLEQASMLRVTGDLHRTRATTSTS